MKNSKYDSMKITDPIMKLTRYPEIFILTGRVLHSKFHVTDFFTYYTNVYFICYCVHFVFFVFITYMHNLVYILLYTYVGTE